MAKKEEIKEQVAQEEQVEAPSEAGAPEGISLNELQLLANIVDLATQRGAFRGNELSQVGAVYDRLTSFLSFVAQQQEEARQNQEQESAQAEDTGE